MGDAPELGAPVWDFSCPDWWKRLKAGDVPFPDLPINRERAERAVGIYNKLRLPDVIGQPSLGEAGGDWFREIVRAVFGSIDDAGVRHVPEVFLQIPKKNSKTTNVAATVVTAALLNQRPHADLMVLGPTQEIARNSFDQTAHMIEADPDGFLQKRFHIRYHDSRIVDRKTKATIAVKTFDVDVVTGSKPIIAIVEELHVLGTKKHAERVIQQLRGGMLPFPESLLMFVTTQSDIPPAGVYKSELKIARAIRDGSYTGQARMLPVIYEFPEAIQTDRHKPWTDSKLWPIVQPNINRSVTLDALERDFEAAKEKGPDAIRLWASQHLNIEIGLALHSERWRGADFWEQCATPGLTLESLMERSEVCVVGVDAGGLDDLTGFAVAGRCRETRRWLYWAHGYADPTVLERRKDIAPALNDFEEAGDLTFTDTLEDSLGDIVRTCEELRRRRLFPEEAGIGLDPAGMGVLLEIMNEAGFDQPLITGVAPQGYKMSSAIWSMERRLKENTIEHGGQPLLTWCVGNAAAEQRGNSVHITKQVAGSAKIDCLIAALIATKLLEENPAPRAADVSFIPLGKKRHGRASRIFTLHG